VSKDVIFYESHFPYIKMFPTASTSHTPSDKSASQSDNLTTTNLFPTPPLTVTQINSIINQPTTSSSLSDTQNITPLSDEPITSNHNNHPMVTRAKTGNLKPKVFLSRIEPTTVKSALTDPHWLQAMQAEYKALMDN
jgi:histone deacetylase 1/2